MGKNQALWTLFDELNDITTTLEKANIASKCLNDIYFGEYSGNNPEIITKFKEASYLYGIVADYVKQSCKLIDDLMN